MLNLLRNLNCKTFSKKNLDLFDQREKKGKIESTRGLTPRNYENLIFKAKSYFFELII